MVSSRRGWAVQPSQAFQSAQCVGAKCQEATGLRARYTTEACFLTWAWLKAGAEAPPRRGKPLAAWSQCVPGRVPTSGRGTLSTCACPWGPQVSENLPKESTDTCAPGETRHAPRRGRHARGTPVPPGHLLAPESDPLTVLQTGDTEAKGKRTEAQGKKDSCMSFRREEQG